MNLTPSYDIKNTKPQGVGFEMLDSAPSAFVVMEECSYDAPYQVARFEHDGTAIKRGAAYAYAVTFARQAQKYDGSQCDYNVYEETR